MAVGMLSMWTEINRIRGIFGQSGVRRRHKEIWTHAAFMQMSTFIFDEPRRNHGARCVEHGSHFCLALLCLSLCACAYVCISSIFPSILIISRKIFKMRIINTGIIKNRLFNTTTIYHQLLENENNPQTFKISPCCVLHESPQPKTSHAPPSKPFRS